MEEPEKRKSISYSGPSEPPELVTKPTPRPTAKTRQQGLPLQGVPGGGYSLPPLELLKEPEPQQADNESDLLRRADLLTEKFAEFAVAGKVVAIHPGPVVTTFEFAPDSGVRFSKVTSLVEDLCLALRAVSIRIDRIPGKSTIGIEVPNQRQEIIYPKDLIGSAVFDNSDSKLTLALGKDIGGDVFVTELDKMPHLLIAGATGAGKSVGLNGMIVSMLYKSTPEDLRFIMIDTKMIELGVYADIPHLLIPVVTAAEGCVHRPQMGGAGNGNSATSACRRRRSQHQAVQRSARRRSRTGPCWKSGQAKRSRSSTCPTS